MLSANMRPGKARVRKPFRRSRVYLRRLCGDYTAQLVGMEGFGHMVAVIISDSDSLPLCLQVLPLAEDVGTVEDVEASEEAEVGYSCEFLLFFPPSLPISVLAWNGALLFHRHLDLDCREWVSDIVKLKILSMEASSKSI